LAWEHATRKPEICSILTKDFFLQVGVQMYEILTADVTTALDTTERHLYNRRLP